MFLTSTPEKLNRVRESLLGNFISDNAIITVGPVTTNPRLAGNTGTYIDLGPTRQGADEDFPIQLIQGNYYHILRLEIKPLANHIIAQPGMIESGDNIHFIKNKKEVAKNGKAIFTNIFFHAKDDTADLFLYLRGGVALESETFEVTFAYRQITQFEYAFASLLNPTRNEETPNPETLKFYRPIGDNGRFTGNLDGGSPSAVNITLKPPQINSEDVTVWSIKSVQMYHASTAGTIIAQLQLTTDGGLTWRNIVNTGSTLAAASGTTLTVQQFTIDIVCDHKTYLRAHFYSGPNTATDTEEVTVIGEEIIQ